MSVRAIPLAPRANLYRGGGFLAAVILAMLVWPAGYAAGAFPWLGYASRSGRSVSIGPGPGVIIGETGDRMSLGLTSFVFFAGQNIVVSYDAEIRRGCLWLQVWHAFRQGRGSNVSQCVTTSGAGEWVVPVTETGYYTVIVNSSVAHGAGPDWDMRYTVWWGAR